MFTDFTKVGKNFYRLTDFFRLIRSNAMGQNHLMLDRLGRNFHIGDAIILLNTFPATIKDFAVRDGELGAVVQRSAGTTGFAYFEEIDRKEPITYCS